MQPTESVQVRVAAKVRPLVEDEKSKGAKVIAQVNGDKVTLEAAGKVSFMNEKKQQNKKTYDM